MRSSLVNKLVFVFLLLMLITFLSSIFVILYQFRNIEGSEGLNGALENIIFGGATIVTVIVLFTIILGRILVFAISRPLEKLIAETEKIANGDYTSEVKVSTNDEIETLAESINLMTTTIREYIAKLKEQRDALQIVFDSISGSILIIDENYSIIMYNEAGGCFYQSVEKKEHLFKKKIDLNGKCFNEFYGRVLPCEGCLVHKTISEGKNCFAEVTNMANVFDMNTSIMPCSGDDVQHKRIIVHSLRVTDQVLMEKEMVQMDKLAQMGRLAAGITHELKNPMSTIKAGIYYLEQLNNKKIPQYIFNVEIKDTLVNMEESLQRAEASVYNILDFSRPNDFKREPIILDKILQQVLLLFSKELIKCKVKVSVEIKENTLIGYYDANMIKNVFIHLISNAMQAMPNGGQLYIHADYFADNVIIVVEDTGIGIQEENVEIVFEPFYTSNKEGGTGLGLWIVKKQLERVGGHIYVSSSDEGTKFTIVLPRNVKECKL